MNAFMKGTTCARCVIGRLPHQADLLTALTQTCAAHEIRAGSITVIGAVTGAAFGYYD